MTGPELDILATKIAERIASPRWMKLTAAVKYSSYSRAQLIELAERRDIVGYPDPDSKRGDWIFDKESIDEYRLSHFFGARQKALSILKSL
ncbi:hypothetical protein [Desulfotignum balticum]|jgi:hypothetical protein|uniref:hypothetical protein n=1 Tax=Desulfotignum balticum TaxID=115781 RepID=UPI000416E0D2|nr:hypothetical protein [Desulfotignum balticum]